MGEPKQIGQVLGQVNTNRKEQEVINYSNKQEVEAYFTNAFPDIKPTAEELFNGLSVAYQSAARRIDEEQKVKKQEERKKYIQSMWTYDQMYETAMNAGKMIAIAENFKNGFVLDQHNHEVFKMLCMYFTNDKNFELYNFNGIPYSLNKGIWLQSSERGSGKSTLLRCFAMNKRCCFGYQHTTELANKYQHGGFKEIDFFIGTIPQSLGALNFFQKEAGFMYDEIFGDGRVNHMGTPLLVSEYIVNKLYDFSNNRKGEMWKFHCTSNADGEDIEKIAGLNYRTRMPDMFNLIKLDGPNRRLL